MADGRRDGRGVQEGRDAGVLQQVVGALAARQEDPVEARALRHEVRRERGHDARAIAQRIHCVPEDRLGGGPPCVHLTLRVAVADELEAELLLHQVRHDRVHLHRVRHLISEDGHPRGLRARVEHGAAHARQPGGVQAVDGLRRTHHVDAAAAGGPCRAGPGRKARTLKPRLERRRAAVARRHQGSPSGVLVAADARSALLEATDLQEPVVLREDGRLETRDKGALRRAARNQHVQAMAHGREGRAELQVLGEEQASRPVVSQRRGDERVWHEAAEEENAREPEARMDEHRVGLLLRGVERLPRRQGRRSRLGHRGHVVDAVPDPDVPPLRVQQGLLGGVLEVVDGREVPAAVEGQRVSDEHVLLSPLAQALQELPQLHAVALEVHQQRVHRPRPIDLGVAVALVEAVLDLEAHPLGFWPAPELLPELGLGGRLAAADAVHGQRLGRQRGQPLDHRGVAHR
mmetsp:Transcript_99082/g.275892  ORF Transcript_99082/g.275892 Transcript_99082/m.275892 type:complete len:461 (+) Transcript_99082:409-1791(+)